MSTFKKSMNFAYLVILLTSSSTIVFCSSASIVLTVNKAVQFITVCACFEFYPLLVN